MVAELKKHLTFEKFYAIIVARKLRESFRKFSEQWGKVMEDQSMTSQSMKSVILEYRALAENYAKKFSRGYPSMRHDMISEALLTLVLAAQDHLDHPNFIAYLKVRLRGALLNMLQRHENNVPYEDICPFRDDYTELYLRDLASTDLFTQDEMQLIHMRMDGSTDEEIADVFGVCRPAIRKRRIAICQKIITQGDRYGINRSQKSVSSRKCGDTEPSGWDTLGDSSGADARSTDKEFAK